MADRYSEFVNSGLGRTLATRLGLPHPTTLRRYAVGQPLLVGRALFRVVGDAPLLPAIERVLRSAGADVVGTDVADTAAAETDSLPSPSNSNSNSDIGSGRGSGSDVHTRRDG